MRTDFSDYSAFFSPGQRVMVAIPVADGDPFNEWALLHSLTDDLAEIQLSRDTLPSGARVEIGTTLELRTGTRGSGYRCRSMVVSLGAGRKVRVRLIGEVILDELREFFRIDVYLPLRLSVTHGDELKVRDEWLEKRAATVAMQLRPLPLSDGLNSDGEQESSWDEIPPPMAANISGGGARLNMEQCLPPGTLVHLEVYLPLHPPTTLNIVGQVITTARLNLEDEKSFSTALRFLHIDERDRDRILEYITTEQLAQLRQYRKQFPRTEAVTGKATKRRRVIAAAVVIIILAVASWLFSVSSTYYRTQTKSEIHRVFEKGLKEYVERFK